MNDTECLVQSEHSNTICLIEIRHDLEDIIFILCPFDRTADILYLCADILIIHTFFLADGFIIIHDREAVNIQRFLDLREIKIKQLLEDLEIIFCKIINGSVIGTHFFTRHRE